MMHEKLIKALEDSANEWVCTHNAKKETSSGLVGLARRAAVELRQLQAEVAALREANRWIPVGERLPEEDQDVFVLPDDKSTLRIYRGGTAACYWLEHFTHWRPLPAPPKEDE